MLPERKLQQKVHDTDVDDLFGPWNCFLWILPGHICFGPSSGPILPYPRWLGVRLWRHSRTFPYRFQHMESVPRTCTCSRVEHHFIFHSHSSQWASGDCLPHQSSHSVIQDTVWDLFSHHPAWNHLNKDKTVFLYQDMAIYLHLLESNKLEGNIQMTVFSPVGVYCPHWKCQLCCPSI